MGYLVLIAFLGLVLLGLLQWGRIVRNRRGEPVGMLPPSSGPAGAADAAPDPTPDEPRPFGRRMAWFAVRADDPDAVAKVLGLRTVQAANWQSGLRTALRTGLFVTPAVDGIVYAAGRDAFPCPGDELRRIGEALLRLSATFGDALWFATHDGVDYHGWAAARGTKLLRGFAYDGDGTEVLWDEGPVTAAEAGLGFFVPDPRDTSGDGLLWWPQSSDVLALAQALGADPSAIQCGSGPCRGLLGRL